MSGSKFYEWIWYIEVLKVIVMIKITAERLYEIRYYVQYVYIPEIVRSVIFGHLLLDGYVGIQEQKETVMIQKSECKSMPASGAATKTEARWNFLWRFR